MQQWSVLFHLSEGDRKPQPLMADRGLDSVTVISRAARYESGSLLAEADASKEK